MSHRLLGSSHPSPVQVRDHLNDRRSSLANGLYTWGIGRARRGNRVPSVPLEAGVCSTITTVQVTGSGTGCPFVAEDIRLPEAFPAR